MRTSRLSPRPDHIPNLTPLQTPLLDRKTNILLDHQCRAHAPNTTINMLLALAAAMRAFAEILHVEAMRGCVFLFPDFAATDTAGDIGDGTPCAAVAGLVRGFLFAEAPGAQGGEDVAQQGPESGEVGDVHGHGSFAEVPVEVGVGDEGRDEAVDFGDDGGDDDEDAHAEDDEEDGFLL